MAISNKELEFNFNEDRMRLRIRNLEQEDIFRSFERYFGYENTSNEPLNNITLDPSIPGCIEESVLSNVSITSMQNAANGFVI